MHIYIFYHLEASRGAGAQSVTVKSTGCGFVFIFHRSGVETKRGATFRHSNALPEELGGKWGNGVS